MKELIIMAGLPASGKSSYIQSNLQKYEIVDCDEIKKSIKGYDPEHPETVHAQSKMMEKAKIYSLLANGESFVLDTTASNAESVVKLTKQAQGLGYRVSVIYLNTKLSICLERNAARERKVPESIIIEKDSVMKASMEIIKKFVDEFQTIEGE